MSLDIANTDSLITIKCLYYIFNKGRPHVGFKSCSKAWACNAKENGTSELGIREPLMKLVFHKHADTKNVYYKHSQYMHCSDGLWNCKLRAVGNILKYQQHASRTYCWCSRCTSTPLWPKGPCAGYGPPLFPTIAILQGQAD